MGKMSAKQWQIVYYCVYFITVFGFLICIMIGWKKTGWFVVFPVGLVLSILLRNKKKISN